MTVKRNDFVDLDRRFEPVGERDGSESDGAGLGMFLQDSVTGLAWPDVLALRAVVILGRAGSGKTRELLHQQQRLSEEGNAAFYVRLEALTVGSLEAALGEKGDPESLEQFRKWKRNKAHGYFFLDALDEARLPRGQNGIVLDEALTAFKRAIGKARNRTSLILSTRGSEWQDETDRPKLKDLLVWLSEKDEDASKADGEDGAGPGDTDAFEAGLADAQTDPADLKILALSPLSRSQLMKLAGAQGIDAASFVAAVETAKAVVLAQTPLEARMLIDVWKGNLDAGLPGATGFDSRRRLFRRAIDYALRPRLDAERRSDLSQPAAMEGLQALAAACTLSGKRDFSLAAHDAACLDSHSILGALSDEWTDASIRQLFSYGFFDPASAGRIRFAIREIQDFLAAEFFNRAIDNLGGNLEPISPLLGEFQTRKHVPPDLFNFFGWLATMNPAARRLVIDIHPTLLMETGDPSLYSLDERAGALVSHAAQYETQVFRGEHFYRNDLEAFAHPDLAPTVADLLSSVTSRELRENLVELARHGNMESIVGLLCDIACNPDEARQVRTEANLALQAFGPDNLHQRVRDSLDDDIAASGQIDPEAASTWNGWLLSGLGFVAPGLGAMSDVMAYLEHLAREPRNLASASGYFAGDLVATAKPALPGDWLGALLDLIIDPTATRDNHLPVPLPSRLMLLQPISDLVLNELREEGGTPPSANLLKAVELFCGLSHRDGSFAFSQRLSEIAARLRAAPEIKFALLRQRLHLVKPDRIWAYEAIASLTLTDRRDQEGLWTTDDIMRALDEAETAETRDEIRTWYAIARGLIGDASPFTDRKSVFKRLKRFERSSNDPEIRRYAPKRPEVWHRAKYRFVHAGGGRRLKRALLDRVFWPWRQVRRAWRVRRILPAIRSGAHLNFLHTAMFEATRNNEAWSVRTVLSHIAETDGRMARNAAEAGYRAVWRSFDPARLTHPDGWAIADVAYAGLQLDRMSGDLLHDGPEAARWCVIALLSEHRKLPDLAGHFLPAHDAVIRQTLEAPLREALAAKPHPQNIPNRLVSALAYGPGPLKDAAAPLIANLLTEQPIIHTDDLAYLLSILLNCGQADQLSQAFVRRQFAEAAAEGQYMRAWAWLEFLFRTDPDEAVRTLDPWTRHVWPQDGTSPFLGFIANYGRLMNRSREDRDRQADALRASALALGVLVRLAWLIAPPETDIRHEDVYSPGTRDKAGEQRRHWTEDLVGLASEMGYQELLRLAALPELAGQRDVFLYHAERLVRLGASRHLIGSEDIPRLMSGLRAIPHTREEFAAYVNGILDGLLERFVNSNHDEARPYRRPDGEPTERDEADFRNWLSARLEETGHEVFSVTREPETAGENRTDILVTARRAELGCVVVEVKLADRSHWSGDALVLTLETQVRDKYLREAEKHAGTLVLLNTRGPAFRKRVGGRLVGFGALVEACEAHAGTLGGDKRYKVLAREI